MNVRIPRRNSAESLAPGNNYAGNAMARLAGSVPTRAHPVTVQYPAVSGPTSFSLDGCVIDASYWRQS